MTFKQWNAAIQLTAQALVGGWLIVDITRQDVWPPTVATVAGHLIWALVFTIGFSIVASIVIAILVSIASGEQLKDERADERDRAINARSMRNAYFIVSIGGGISLLMLAFSVDPALAAYVLFGSLILGGATDSGSRLLYYRWG